jgi:hypothetical protein
MYVNKYLIQKRNVVNILLSIKSINIYAIYAKNHINS